MASSSVDSELQPHKVAQFPSWAHRGTGFQKCIGDWGTQFPKLTRGYPHWKSDWSPAWQNVSWWGLKFSIHATACLHWFKGQKLNQLQSMPDKIHTHRRISNIPNNVLLAWLYFEATSFHSSPVSFHSLFLPLECFCKAAYKLLALNKKMLGFFVVIWIGFFFNLLQQQLQGLYFHQDSPWESKPQSNKREQRTERTEKSPKKPLRRPDSSLYQPLASLYPKEDSECSEVDPCRRWWL